MSIGQLAAVRFDVIPEAAITSGEVNLLDRVSFDEGRVFSGKRSDTKMVQYRAKPGDIVVSKINARKKAIGIVPDGPDVGITIHFRALVPDYTKVDREFLWLALRSSYYRNQFDIQTGGVGKGEISEDRLMEVLVPSPSLQVQRAIAARWQQAQAEVVAARERVERMESEIPLLVCRELGSPPPVPSDSVQKCMALRWKDLERWSFNYLTRARQGLLGFTRSSFPIVPLSDCLVETMNGYCIKPVGGPTPYKMLKLNALTPAGLDVTLSKFINVPDSIAERFSIHKDDLFICRSVGSYDLVAKCAVAKEDEPNLLFPDIMIRVRFTEAILPEYAREVIQTPLGRSYFQSNARTAVGMWKIGAEDIRNFPMPLPPLEVQSAIVRRVETAREEIARERQAAERKAWEIEAEVEGMILGTERM